MFGIKRGQFLTSPPQSYAPAATGATPGAVAPSPRSRHGWRGSGPHPRCNRAAGNGASPQCAGTAPSPARTTPPSARRSG